MIHRRRFLKGIYFKIPEHVMVPEQVMQETKNRPHFREYVFFRTLWWVHEETKNRPNDIKLSPPLCPKQ